jgi:anti-anti-sigma factor
MSFLSRQNTRSGAQQSPTQSLRVEPFRVEVHRERNAARVTPVGEMDMATVGQVKDQLRDLQGAGHHQLVIDLRRLTFMDSTGVHLLLECDAHARQDGIDFAIIQGPPAIHRVLEITGLSERLPCRAEAFDG